MSVILQYWSTFKNFTSNYANGTELTVGETITITLKADEGYYFSTAPKNSMNSSVNTDDIDFDKISDTEYTLTFTVPNTAYLYITGTTSQYEPVELKFSPALTNYTSNYADGTQLTVGKSVTITLTANDGYYFDSIPKNTLEPSTSSDDIDFDKISDTEYTLTFTVPALSVSSFYIYGTTAEYKTLNFSSNLTNYTSNYSESVKFKIGETITITLTANDGYVFDGTPSLYDGTTYNKFEKISDTECTLTFTIPNTSTLNIYGLTKEYKEEKYITLNISSDLTNYTSNYIDGTQLTIGESVTITLTANDGYYFDSIPYISYDDVTTNFNKVSDTEYNLTLTIPDITSNILIFGSTAEIIEDKYITLNISSDLTNYTSNYVDGTQLTIGETFTITLTANDGYYFDSIPYISYDDVTTNFNKVSDSEYNLSLTIPDITSNILIFGSTAEIIEDKYITISFYNKDGYTAYHVSSNLSEVAVGKTATIILNADDGYYFSTTPYIYDVDGSVIEFEKISDTQYTLTLIVPDKSSLSIYITTVAYCHFELNTSFLSCNVDNITQYKPNDIVDLVITANTNYFFDTPPYLGFYKNGRWTKIELTSTETSDYKTTYNLSFTIPENTTVITIYATAIVKPIVDKYGLISIYNPTASELKALGDVRYKIWIADTNTEIDLGQFITNLIKIFVYLPDGDKQNILLGGYDSGVTAKILLNDVVETDCGSIEIKGKYNNIMDYRNTTIEIYLPFIGFKTLDTNKVMNENIKLIYKTNVITGDSIACIYNSTNILLYTFDCNVGYNIPYKTNGVFDDRSYLRPNSNYLYGFTPSITIRTNKDYNTTLITANDNRITTIGNEMGFIACSQIFNTIKATTEEKEKIDSILKAGIIV